MSGASVTREFGGHAGHDLREWVARHYAHPEARQVAGELWVTVRAATASRVLGTVSDVGDRVRISVAGSRPLGLWAFSAVALRIVESLAVSYGSTLDGRGVWAEIARQP